MSTYKAVLSGAGVMSNAYNLFCINLVKNVLFGVYDSHDFSKPDSTALANSQLVGAIIGQLTFGALADKIGRRATFIATISMVIIGCLASMTATNGLPISLTAQLCIWRGIVGVGIGGEYPLSATVSAEGVSTAGRGRVLASVMAMQGFGNILSTLVMYILLVSGMPLDWVWRAALGLGALPGILTIYGRLRMVESTHYSKKVEAELADASAGGYGQAAAGRGGCWGAVRRTLATLYEWRWALAGTAGSWFIFDIAYYGQSLFTGTVLTDIGLGGGSSSRHALEQVTLGNLVVNFISLPGYFVGLLLVDRLGRKRIQLVGFVLVGVLFTVMSAALTPLKANAPAAFIVLYGLSYLVSNAGPNLSTYIIPAEAFPTAIKATCHGFSAAMGKTGAVLGTSLFNPLQDAFGTEKSKEDGPGLQLVLYVCAACSLLGAVWTWVFTTETQHHSIEALDAGHRDGDAAKLLDADGGEVTADGEYLAMDADTFKGSVQY